MVVTAFDLSRRNDQSIQECLVPFPPPSLANSNAYIFLVSNDHVANVPPLPSNVAHCSLGALVEMVGPAAPAVKFLRRSVATLCVAIASADGDNSVAAAALARVVGGVVGLDMSGWGGGGSLTQKRFVRAGGVAGFVWRAH